MMMSLLCVVVPVADFNDVNAFLFHRFSGLFDRVTEIYRSSHVFQNDDAIEELESVLGGETDTIVESDADDHAVRDFWTFRGVIITLR